MSVLVKNMEMPNVCAYCFLDASECDLHPKVDIWRERHPDCPLVKIPTPHGRLIDADKFEFEMDDKLLVALTEKYGEEEAQKGLHFSFRDCISNIQFQPTVIEAEGET